jgi:hypothetical protein
MYVPNDIKTNCKHWILNLYSRENILNCNGRPSLYDYSNVLYEYEFSKIYQVLKSTNLSACWCDKAECDATLKHIL